MPGLRIHLLAILLATGVMMTDLAHHSLSAQSPDVEWAIAIHGGAGSDPERFQSDKREAREAGLEKALRAGKQLLARGGSALDAVETVIRSLEDDASFNAGRGAVLTKEGKAELDASIMDGRTRGCGAVAGVTTVKNPISAARKVMTETKHVLLIGEGADAFSESQGIPVVDPSYFLSHRKRRDSSEMHYGTVGCVALDRDGNLAAGTSTGGTAKKLPGRVGDSPIVGAGTFADNATCAVSGTGVGEEYIRNAIAYDVSARMQYQGDPLADAADQAIFKTLSPGSGGLISLSHRGEIVMRHNTPGMSCGAADSLGRFEVHLKLPKSINRDDGLQSPGSDELQIRKIIDQQARHWNAGDLDAFMAPYWKSDQLSFSSGGNVTRGWQATLDRYRERYPDRSSMGTVRFSELEFLRLDEQAFQVLGVWALDRSEEPLGGRFTLIFRHLPEGWKIVHDHTSLSQEKAE